MSERDRGGPSKGGGGRRDGEGPRSTPGPMPGKSSLVQRRYGMIQRRSEGARPPVPPPPQQGEPSTTPG